MFNSMKHLSECLLKLSNGDFNVKIDSRCLNAKGCIGDSARYLQQLVTHLREDTDTLKSASEGKFKKTQGKGELDTAVNTAVTSLQTLTNQANYIEKNILYGLSDLSDTEGQLNGSYDIIERSISALMDRVYVLENILDGLPWMVSMTDMDEKWFYLNKYALDILGYSTNKTVTKQEVFGTVCEDPTALSTHKVLKAEGLKEQTISGAGMHFQINLNYVNNRKGDPVGIVSISQDITKRVAETEFKNEEVERIKNNLLSLAKGDFDFNLKMSDAKVEKEVKDIFSTINSSFMEASSAINMLTKEISKIASNFSDGNTKYRADETLFAGAYRDIVYGINSAMDEIVLPMNSTSQCLQNISLGKIPDKIEGQYKGDYAVLMQSLNACMGAINEMVSDVTMLINAAKDGKLSIRADASRHNGDFGKIISGVNMILQLITDPIKESLMVLEDISKGKLDTKVTGEYKGDNALIKDAVNNTLDSLNTYINEISSVLSSMADGNLDCALKADYKGNFVEIENSLTHIISSLNDLIGRVKVASSQVASGSKQVSMGSQNLSQGATEQASSIEELTSSIAEIASQTKQNASNAAKASEISSTAQAEAAQGNAKMNEMLTSMQEISVASSNISKIIKVIDDIAFQTNILALNAAVEAARAGQYGKGFAVVAEEVRNLAGKSAEAAKNTTLLIEGSINKVKAGMVIANETAEMLNQISESIQKAAALVNNIAAASNEQATSIAQIDQGILQVSNVVQTNSATAEESAASSEELSGQSEALMHMVEKFKLNSITVV